MGLLGPVAFYVVATALLGWIATKVRGTSIGGVVAAPMYFLAAFSIGWALEGLLMQLIGAIPGGQPWPVITWTVLGVTGVVIAATARQNGWLAVIPCIIIGVTKITHGIRQWIDPEHWLEWGDLRLDQMVPAAHASLYTGVIMICIGIAVMTEIPSVKCHRKVCELCLGVMAAGILTIPWLLPIAWYWEIVVLLGFLQLSALTMGFFEFALRSKP